MYGMKITDNNIIDCVLRQAAPDLKNHMQRSIKSDPAIAARHSHWSRILQATQACAAEEQAMQQGAMDSVMRRIREKSEAGAERRQAWGFRPRSMARSACGRDSVYDFGDRVSFSRLHGTASRTGTHLAGARATCEHHNFEPKYYRLLCGGPAGCA